ncbi:hypothetical protein M427DRAFT_59562 [Gonapodya prolifera JEL478]|uniref:Uncharacterized protein n=1 Tax=Gonapodya prolifera (strain JEL478) TaxID=1344416 RepID=A0A139A6I7_GONPJ|nr:hypothetical protein M427DRAFT_59562 [Gonapodya prolifera JEL478]|eukprot:KXS12416.1 hypothetical protein M427DRAFT_59562 [Gonapodya prolifera JEL478]
MPVSTDGQEQEFVNRRGSHTNYDHGPTNEHSCHTFTGTVVASSTLSPSQVSEYRKQKSAERI